MSLFGRIAVIVAGNIFNLIWIFICFLPGSRSLKPSPYEKLNDVLIITGNLSLMIPLVVPLILALSPTDNNDKLKRRWTMAQSAFGFYFLLALAVRTHESGTDFVVKLIGFGISLFAMLGALPMLFYSRSLLRAAGLRLK